MNHAERILSTFVFSLFASSACAMCSESGSHLQILGSGGPGAAGGRASAGYLLWMDGVARIMVDAGSGTKDQFHASGATLADLQLIALSHFHPDHSSELPGIFWPTGGNMRIAGPSGAGLFPSLDQFLNRNFGAEGTYPVLADRLQMEALTIDVSGNRITDVWRDGDVRVTAMGVPHGDVPTLGFRIDIADSSIAFTSDQNGSNPAFIDFIREVDTLVIHFATSENPQGAAAQLHARPSIWGQMATAANVGQVVVSHISFEPGEEFDSNLAILRENYRGPLIIAEDLACLDVEAGNN